MPVRRSTVQLVVGLLLIAAPTWVLLAPLFDGANPTPAILGVGALSFVLGFLLVGRAARASIDGGSTERPPVPEGQTMEYLDRR